MSESCKDCLHYQMCIYSDGNKRCPCFTDCSEWVKLPCNIGKTVYFIRNNKIIDTEVEKIVIKKNGIYLKLACNTMYETSCKSIGKTVFFDRKEAEKVLRALEEKA